MQRNFGAPRYIYACHRDIARWRIGALCRTECHRPQRAPLGRNFIERE